MKITLINPPWYISERQFWQKKSLSQCLGLGYIASYLEVNGQNITFIDALAEGINDIKKVELNGQHLLREGLAYEAIAERIPKDTGLIGISVPFTNLAHIAKELSRFIKDKYPEIPIIAGGVHPSTLPLDCLDGGVDYVIRGEGELPLLDFAQGKNPSQIRGLVFKKDGQIIDNGSAELINDLDQIPFPFRAPLLMERYLTYSPRGEKHKRSLSVITSRGCPYDCLFCSVHPVSGYRWRARSVANVLGEISYNIEKYDVNHIEFEDDNLTLEGKRAEEIFDGILALDKKITWAVQNGLRVDTLSAGLLGKMKRSGCIQANLAIESGNQKVLDLMHKKLSLKKVEEVVGICKELGMPNLGFFLIGFPGETSATFEETLKTVRLLKKKGLKSIGAMIVNAYPGTKLHAFCKQKGYLAPDIERHIFVDDDYVSISTENFNAERVIYWRDKLQGIFYPWRWHIKELLRFIFKNNIFNNLINKYRSARDSILGRVYRISYE